MAGINIFVNADVMNYYAGTHSSLPNHSKKDLRIEFIEEAPLTADVVYTDEQAEIMIYVRDGAK